MGNSRETLKKFPDPVRREIGFGLGRAQEGGKYVHAKPLKGFGGAGVLEIISDFDGDTFRAIYTVRFAKAVYTLHCFQKKSKHGIETPKSEIESIRRRLKLAEQDYKEKYEKETQNAEN